MRDIKKARRAEQEYLRNKMEGIDSNFLSTLREIGYDSIAEYVSERDIDSVRDLNLQIYHYPPKEAIEFFFDSIKNKRYCLIIVDVPKDSPIAFIGKGNNTEESCINSGVVPYNIGTLGGTVFCQAEDLTFGMVLPRNFDIPWLSKVLCDILNQSGGHFEVAGNDVLLDGKKVVAVTKVSSVTEISALGVNISFTDSSFLISRICKKKGKEPGHISNNILQKIKLIKGLIQWLHRQ